MYLVDLSISKTEWSQNSIPSGLYLWPVLLHRHLGNAHDWQLHLLQLPPMCPWFLSDQPETYYYPVHQHDPEDWIRVDKSLCVSVSKFCEFRLGVVVHWHNRSAISIHDVWIKCSNTAKCSDELLLILLLLFLVLIYFGIRA